MLTEGIRPSSIAVLQKPARSYPGSGSPDFEGIEIDYGRQSRHVLVSGAFSVSLIHPSLVENENIAGVYVGSMLLGVSSSERPCRL